MIALALISAYRRTLRKVDKATGDVAEARVHHLFIDFHSSSGCHHPEGLFHASTFSTRSRLALQPNFTLGHPDAAADDRLPGRMSEIAARRHDAADRGARTVCAFARPHRLRGGSSHHEPLGCLITRRLTGKQVRMESQPRVSDFGDRGRLVREVISNRADLETAPAHSLPFDLA